MSKVLEEIRTIKLRDKEDIEHVVEIVVKWLPVDDNNDEFELQTIEFDENDFHIKFNENKNKFFCDYMVKKVDEMIQRVIEDGPRT